MEHPGEKVALEEVDPFGFGGPAYSHNVNETVDAIDSNSVDSDPAPEESPASWTDQDDDDRMPRSMKWMKLKRIATITGYHLRYKRHLCHP